MANQIAKENCEALAAALADFEESLEQPVVPGEMVSWLQNAAAAAAQVGPPLAACIASNHAEVLEQIADEDAEMLSRVAELKEEDAEICEDYERRLKELERLAELTASAEPDEEKFAEHVETVMRESLDFIIRVRKQEAALTTWSQEAFNRDRGDVD